METAHMSRLPDALLLMGSHCPYCPLVLKSLKALAETGHIGNLETYNIEENPEIARQTGVRSVPWVRIGPFELEGLRSESELREWAVKAGSESGLVDYLNELLATGNIGKALETVRRNEASLKALMALFSDPDTGLNIRIGISAIMEELEGSERLSGLIDRLGELTKHPAAHIRGDACHYLALTRNPQAVPYIRPLLEDSDASVSTLARESLASLEQDHDADEP
jgi:hypothetical protein